MIENERALREESNYLKSVYKYSNYDNYVLISIEEDQVKFSDLGGVWHHNIIRERTNFDRTFYLKKKISTKAFIKELKDDYLYYKPGVLFNDNSFIAQSLDFNLFLLKEIKENISSNNLQRSRLSLTIKAYKKKEFKEYPVCVLNNKTEEIEKLVAELPWYENEMVYKTISIKCRDIFSVGAILNAIQEYLKLGFDIEKLTEKIEPFKNDKPNITPSSIFEFINDLIFKNWSEVTNRVGKDNRINSGIIIEGFEVDKYLIKIIERNSEFILTSDNRLKSYNDTYNGYIKSSPYEESKPFEDNRLKQRILTILIKNYNSFESYLFKLEI